MIQIDSSLLYEMFLPYKKWNHKWPQYQPQQDTPELK